MTAILPTNATHYHQSDTTSSTTQPITPANPTSTSPAMPPSFDHIDAPAPHPPQPPSVGAKLLHALLDAVRELQTAYGSQNLKELATDADERVRRLCDLWDTILSHGLRATVHTATSTSTATSSSASNHNMTGNDTQTSAQTSTLTAATALLHNVADRVAVAVTGSTANTLLASANLPTPFGGGSGNAGGHPSPTFVSPTFWSFAWPDLTAHERERFRTLQLVHTDYARGRALLRAALNERTLERYVLVWLNAPQLTSTYESHAVLRDPEATNLLPSIAAGLGAILFAVLVDNVALNGPIDERWLMMSAGERQQHSEPIIVAPPAQLVRVVPARRRRLVSFGATEDEEEMGQGPGASSGGGGSPKTLSDMCLRQDGDRTTTTATKTVGKPAGKPADAIVSHCSNLPQRPYEAVFDMQPELPSEIVEIPVMVAATLRDPTPVRIDTASSSAANPPAFYELVADDHSATEAAQQNRQQLDNNTTSSRNTSNSDGVGDSESHDIDTDIDNRTNITSTSNGTDDDDADTEEAISSISSNHISARVNTHHQIGVLKERVHYMTERCAQLETRVAELNLENHRLQGLCGADAAGGQPSVHFAVSLPRVYLDRSARRPFYVYEVRVAATLTTTTAADASPVRREEWTVMRRYSDFLALHRAFRRQNVAVGALEFPPKKHFGNMDTKFVELRRQRLQVYIRHFFAVVPESRACKTRVQLECVLPFFRPGPVAQQ